MRASSRVWPYYTPWTLADVKTAAWLVENGHLTQLETVVFPSDLDTSTVHDELETINKVANDKMTKSDDEVFTKIKGQDIFWYPNNLSNIKKIIQVTWILFLVKMKYYPGFTALCSGEKLSDPSF